MQKLRSKRRKSPTELKTKALCNGPGKLTDALQITKALFNKESLLTNSEMWIEDAPDVSDDDIVCCPRIGIDYATKEWKEKPLRFYIRGNSCVSKRDKDAEQLKGQIDDVDLMEGDGGVLGFGVLRAFAVKVIMIRLNLCQNV